MHEPDLELKSEPKQSIFICKDCKKNQVKIEKKPKQPRSEIIEVKLEPAKQKDKKWQVKLLGKTIAFGSKEMTDYLISQDEERKYRYIQRHEKRESQFWSPEQENLLTASLWSRFLLWEEKSLQEAIEKLEKRMGCSIKYTKNTVDKHLRKLARLAKASQASGLPEDS